jgi:hypothetical protein
MSDQLWAAVGRLVVFALSFVGGLYLLFWLASKLGDWLSPDLRSSIGVGVAYAMLAGIALIVIRWLFLKLKYRSDPDSPRSEVDSERAGRHGSDF